MGKIELSYRGEHDEKAPALKYVLQSLHGENAPRLALFHSGNLPFEIEEVFRATEALEREELGGVGSPFLGNLRKHCRAIGFAPALVFSRDPEEFRPLDACNILIGDPEMCVPRPVFTGLT